MYENVSYQNHFLFKEKVVLDVEVGIGILSFFYAKVGEKHIYVVEWSTMEDIAKGIV